MLDAKRVAFEAEGAEKYRVVSPDGELLALGEIGENKELNVIQRFKVFREKIKSASEEPLVEPKNGLRDISDLKGVTLS